jgi:uncharacterized protein YdaU (DUF1376 family)
MPLYTDDFLVITRDLTTQEKGACLLLLVHRFLDGSLPKSDGALRRITGVHRFHWPKVRDMVMPLIDNLWVASVERFSKRLAKPMVSSIGSTNRAKKINENNAKFPDSRARPLKKEDNTSLTYSSIGAAREATGKDLPHLSAAAARPQEARRGADLERLRLKADAPLVASAELIELMRRRR